MTVFDMLLLTDAGNTRAKKEKLLEKILTHPNLDWDCAEGDRWWTLEFLYGGRDEQFMLQVADVKGIATLELTYSRRASRAVPRKVQDDVLAWLLREV